ncbi:DUF5013 domain-containing protein [Mucilaginibacter terrae]|uniref:DUF5013 domain-containing protein n=1 Tax=Mucilaginibacter terrae TaxID=1955052 RepID=A0ABU3GNI1_9SPHI|nr:DUF5013 domain-containing protein [Mucilaginibacter terrae]MDT3401155.1 hypothetical protein [Mucilaginibacter terrae]
MNILHRLYVSIIIVAGALLVLNIAFLSSCQREDFVDKVSSTPSVVKFDYPALLNAVSINNIAKADDKIVFPVQISLENPANSTFTIDLNSEPQVAASLLVDNAAVINMPEYSMPQSVEVRFGTKYVTFDVSVSSTTIERNYGKKLVLAITLSNPSKSQKLDESKKTVAFSINTSDIAQMDDLHFLSFTSAVNNPSQVVTSLTSSNLNTNGASFDNGGFSIKAQVDLGGKPARGFKTLIGYNPDTLKALVAKGLLPAGTAILTKAALGLPDVILADYKSSVVVEMRINMDSIFARFPSKVAVAFTLSNPEKYQVNAAKSTLVYLIDPLRVFSDITKVLKNTSQPFKTSSIDPNQGRWGVLSDWLFNSQANLHQSYSLTNELNGSYGSFDNNNSTQIAFESGYANSDSGKPGGSPTAPNITNGKIYQTVVLPPGTYKFDANVRGGVTTDNTKGAYSVAAIGSNIPDIAGPTTPANFIGRVAINGAGSKSFNFTLNSTTTISLGFVAVLSGNQSVFISGVTLTRTLNP